MNVDDVVRERIEAARRRAAAEKQRRADLQAARQHGLPKRHAQKLRNLAAREPEAREPQTPEEPVPVRVASCPSCRAERVAQRVAGVLVSGRPHDVLRCSDKACELLWLVRADRPRVPVAA